LIELPVVIAIIAILASLLLPALSRGKDKAHQIVCLNHQKQLMLATQMYADDSDSLSPRRIVGDQGMVCSNLLWFDPGTHSMPSAAPSAELREGSLGGACAASGALSGYPAPDVSGAIGGGGGVRHPRTKGSQFHV
jgi:type II secretory pathway pseudopilin PulG